MKTLEEKLVEIEERCRKIEEKMGPIFCDDEMDHWGPCCKGQPSLFDRIMNLEDRIIKLEPKKEDDEWVRQPESTEKNK